MTSNDKISDVFNNFFCNIGHEYGKNFDKTLPTAKQHMDKGSFTLPKMSVEFVRKEVKSMSNAKATGLDGISVQLLKISLDAVDEILTFIFNFSIESGYVENDWKRARVTPPF